MRTTSRRLFASRAVAVRPDVATPSVAPARPKHLAAVQRGADAVSGRVDAVAGKIFAGSSDRACYTADSPLLSQALREQQPQPVRERVHAPASARETPAPVEVEPVRSLAELQQMSGAELKSMLEVRGVGTGGKTEKAELARWVQQHQDLPVKGKAASRDVMHTATGDPSKSLAEFKEMPVKELREFLHERGVNEGACSEKSELVQWVYEHRDLPVLYEGDPRRQQRFTRGFGPGRGGDSHDMPRDEREEKEKQEQIEGEEQKKLEGEETKLLEGATAESPSRWRWFWIPLAAVGTIAAALVAVAVNDSQSAVAKSDTATQRVQGQPAK